MEKKLIRFSSSATQFYFDGSLRELSAVCSPESTILLTDENVYSAHKGKFRGWKTIIVEPGEQFKNQATADKVIAQMISLKADRTTTLVGIGGGVITDLAGYIGGIYMRGIRVGFVPTSILAMVDASIGGKNGIDVGVYKNLVGLIRQPDFLLYDTSLLKSLPEEEWINGMAEIIKHAAIRDAAMFRQLEATTLPKLKRNKETLNALIRRNALLKVKVVLADEFEKNERRLLNFGHTIGHAIENHYSLKHGFAIARGMVAAAALSRKLLGYRDSERLANLIAQYGLPTDQDFDRKAALDVLGMDKKREKSTMNFVLLEKTGKAVVHPIAMNELGDLVNSI